MDTRNYDEPNNCGLEDCDCSEVNKCGCTYPNNISPYGCKAEINGISPFSDEPTNFQGEPALGSASRPRDTDPQNQSRRVKDDTVCVCDANECDCNSEITDLSPKL